MVCRILWIIITPLYHYLRRLQIFTSVSKAGGVHLAVVRLEEGCEHRFALFFSMFERY